MNNFLDNLAERAMNAEQGVRPRLPSRFEPARPGSEPAWQERGEPAGAESFDVTLEQGESDASPAPSFSQRQGSELRRDSQSGERNDRPLAVGRRLWPAHQVFQPDKDSLLVSAAAPDGEFEQASPKPAIAPLRPKPPSAVDRRETMVEEKVVRQSVNEPSIRPALQSSSATGNEHRGVEVRPASVNDSREVEARAPQVSSLIAPRANPVTPVNVSRDEAPAVEAARNEASTPLVVRPKLDRYAEPPMQRTQTQSAPPSSEQVINVTIGRIEVRATPPPPATARSNHQKPPVMSLDDYLRQRSGRGGGV